MQNYVLIGFLRFFILFVFLFLPVTVFAGDKGNSENPSTKYSAGLAFGANNFNMKDEYLAPSSCKGWLVSIGFNFSAENKCGLHEAGGWYSFGDPKPEKEDFLISQKAALLSYAYLLNLSVTELWGSDLIFRAGGGVSTFVMNSDLDIASKTYQGTFSDQSWYWAHSINILAQADYKITEEKNIRIELSLPVYQVVSRPENGHWLNKKNSEVMYDSFLNAAKGGTGEFITNTPDIFINLSYKSKMNDGLSFVGKYGLIISASNRPFDMGMYMNCLSAGFELSL